MLMQFKLTVVCKDGSEVEHKFPFWYDLLNYVTSMTTLEMKSYKEIRAEYIKGYNNEGENCKDQGCEKRGQNRAESRTVEVARN